MAPTTPRWPLRRFVVRDKSMEPALHAGDGLLATPYGPVRRGQIRCLPDPRQPGRWLVKRVAAVRAGRIEVLSDNAAATLADSRSFGPVPASGTYLVLLRIPARLL